MDSEQNQFTTDFRKFVSLIDRLHYAGYNKHLSFPRIAVIGSPSVGKSSIIEQIVGHDFIPKGHGIVTRRPLEIRIVNVSKEKLSQPYGVFEEIPGQNFSDFKQIEMNIVTLTEQVCGKKNKYDKIMDMPIVLTIFQTTCPDLIIIDLPGIQRTPIKDSDARVGYDKVTKDIARRYCSDLNSIILCVESANSDINGQNDSLNMARYIDPKGIRTIRVLTKIDIMDKGTNAKCLLEGSGFVGVKNRSIQFSDEAIEEEQKFFATNPVYSSLPPSLFGTKSLTNKIIDVFKAQFRILIPKIVSEIQNQINKQKDRLKELGKGMKEEDTDKMKILWKIIDDFSLRYNNSINCNYNSLSTSDNNILPEGYRIRQIFNNLYKETMQTQPTDIYTDKEIERSVILYSGDGGPNYESPPIDCFFFLFKPLFEAKLKKPAFECINEIYHVLKELAVNILTITVKTGPDLKDELQELILNHLKNERDSCINQLENLFDQESYFFTNDIEYLISQPPSYFKSNSHKLRKKVDDYFLLVMRGLSDSVPKMIGCFLVKASQVIFISYHLQNISQENYFEKHKLYSVFKEAINQNSKYIDLVVETESIVQERNDISNEVETLKEQTEMLRKDFDFSRELEKYVKLTTEFKDEREKALKNSFIIKEQLSQNAAKSISNTNQNESPPRNQNNIFSQSNQEQQNKSVQDVLRQTMRQATQQTNSTTKSAGFKFW